MILIIRGGMRKEYYLPSIEPMTKRKNKKYSGRKKPHFPSSLLGRKPSKMESKVADLLKGLRVEFVTEKTFPRLVSELYPDVLLPLDFYLPKYKASIEVDGEHHTKEIAGDKPDSLDKRILNDATRDLFCLKKGITMLRISHEQFEDYKEIVTEFINKLKNR